MLHYVNVGGQNHGKKCGIQGGACDMCSYQPSYWLDYLAPSTTHLVHHELMMNECKCLHSNDIA